MMPHDGRNTLQSETPCPETKVFWATGKPRWADHRQPPLLIRSCYTGSRFETGYYTPAAENYFWFHILNATDPPRGENDDGVLCCTSCYRHQTMSGNCNLLLALTSPPPLYCTQKPGTYVVCFSPKILQTKTQAFVARSNQYTTNKLRICYHHCVSQIAMSWIANAFLFCSPTLSIASAATVSSSSDVPSHDFHSNICSACAVTVVIFGHLNHFYSLTYLFTYSFIYLLSDSDTLLQLLHDVGFELF